MSNEKATGQQQATSEAVATQPHGGCLAYIQHHQASKKLPPVRTAVDFLQSMAACGFFVDGPYETGDESPVRQVYGTLMTGVICYASLPPKIVKAVQVPSTAMGNLKRNAPN